MEIKVTDANTVTLTDNNYDLSSEVWHVSVMSSGVGNAPISLPTISTDTQVFGFSGVIKPTVGLSRWYPANTSTVSKFYASIEVAPTNNITIQLYKNNTALGDNIIILAGNYKSNTIDLSTNIGVDDYLTVNIISGTTGSNLFATVALQSVPQISLTSIATPKATVSNLGFVKVGSGLSVDNSGKLNVVPTSTVSTVFEDNHDFSCHALGTLLASQVIGMELASKAYLMQGVGYARALTAPTNNVSLEFRLNTTSKGTIYFSAGTNVGTVTIESNLSIAPGDLLRIIAPSVPDATLADVAIVIGGSGALALSLPAATATTLGLVKVGNGLAISSSGVISL